MHWSEWAALVFAVVVAVPLVLLLCYFLYFAWGLTVVAWESRKPLVTVEAPSGPFVKQDDQWSGQVKVGDKELDVFTRDAEGRPSPELLNRLPAILEQLPQLEQAVPQQVDGVTNRHELSSISEGDADGAEFVLGFSYEEEAWGETVFVDFQAGQVIGWTVVD